MGRNNKNNKKDDESHFPSWMDESNDSKHKAETVPLLFGAGAAAADEENDDTDVENGTRDYGTVDRSQEVEGQEDQEDPSLKEKASPKQQHRSSLIDLSSKPHMPTQNPCLWLFHFLNGSAVVTALCIILTQILPLLLSQNRKFAGVFTVLNMFLKFYIVLFCILFILVETDVPVPLLRNSALLQAFWSRGVLYSFLGLISTVEAYSDEVELYLNGNVYNNRTVQIGWSGIFMQVSAWFLLAIGVVYMLLGLCCLKRVRDRMKEREQQAWQTYRQQLREWKNRREILGGEH